MMKNLNDVHDVVGKFWIGINNGTVFKYFVRFLSSILPFPVDSKVKLHHSMPLHCEIMTRMAL